MADFNGTSGDDIFTGGADNDTAAGNGGNDQLSGGGGEDVIGGGSGADTLDGGGGSDRLYSFDISPPFNRPYYGNSWTAPLMDIGIEFDVLAGGAGGDELFAGYGDTVDGGADTDILYISFLGASAGVTVDFRQLQNNGAIVIGGGTLSNIEATGWIEGSNFDDVITDGYSSSNFAPMFGHGGNDQLIGGTYTGNMYGGDGDDLIDRRGSTYSFEHFGEDGNDTLIGGGGYERLDGGDGNDIIQGNYGFDDLWGGEGDDSLDGGSFGDNLRGGAGNDTMYGAGDADTVDGGAGDDILYGDFSLISSAGALSPSSNDERMWGGIGADIIHGNQGNDTIWSGERDGDFGHLGRDDAGLERDQLFGGEGDDTLAMGLGDDADGGTGSDSLRISLAGAASGVTFGTSGFVPGGIWSVTGGTVQNIEVLTAITGSAFGDSISVATHAFGINVDGGAGNDLITSLGSSVIVNGGAGNDRFVSGIAGDVFDGGADVDTADYGPYGSAVVVTLALAAGGTGSGPGGDQLINVENVDGSAQGDTIGGSDQANLLRGLGGNDTLRGNGGDDVLMGGAGDDTTEGGLGNDMFHVDSAGDVVEEAVGEGSDRVLASLSYTLGVGASVEMFTTTNHAGTTAIDLTGNALANTIFGNDGANILNGGGGADTLVGRLGDDVYHVDNVGDRIVETAGQGNDRVFASASYVLSAGAWVELLTTTNNFGTTAINLTGNELANAIYGNDGANALDGGGGADTLVGRLGDDFYYVDNAADRVVETAGQGNDRVFASASYALAAGASVEMVTTANHGGTTAINLTGNELANTIYGNDGANILNGGGEADLLVGRLGDDFYYVDNVADLVVEAGGQGNDRVSASVSYTLGAGVSVEMFTTTNNAGTTALDLTGNALANIIYGNDGANILDGKGGSDTLVGRAGADTFAFTATLAAGNIDRIVDFVAGVDEIALDDAVFTQAGGLGALHADAFHIGSAAADADDRIIYNSATGALLYDADGNGGGAAVQFATLGTGLALGVGDFTVI